MGVTEEEVWGFQVFRVPEQAACDDIQIPREEVTFTGMGLVVTVAVAGVGAAVEHGEFGGADFGKDADSVTRDPVKKGSVVFLGKELSALNELIFVFALVFAACVMFGMDEPVLPVAADCRAFVFFKDLKCVQNSLRQVFFTGGVIGVSEEITKQPDIIKTAGRVLGNANKAGERSAVFVQIRDDEMPVFQDARLSCAMTDARFMMSVRLLAIVSASI